MSLILPAWGGRVPEDFDWSGDATYARNAVAHPCLPVVPFRRETLEAGRPAQSGGIYVPPQIVIDCAWVKEWSINASVTNGPVSISASSTFGGGEDTWADRVYPSTSSFSNFTQFEEASPLDSLRITVTIGRMGDNVSSTQWSPSGWWPSLVVDVDGSTDDDGATTERLGYSGSDPTGTISLTVAGLTLPMFRTQDNGTLSGSITLEPVSYY